MFDCLCAIDFLHKATVMHRDIKPANILLTENNQIRICDFGLSRTYEPSTVKVISTIARHPNLGFMDDPSETESNNNNLYTKNSNGSILMKSTMSSLHKS